MCLALINTCVKYAQKEQLTAMHPPHQPPSHHLHMKANEFTLFFKYELWTRQSLRGNSHVKCKCLRVGGGDLGDSP